MSCGGKSQKGHRALGLFYCLSISRLRAGSIVVQSVVSYVAVPLAAMTAAPLEPAMLVWYRRALNWKAVWRLSAASVASIPLGILALKQVNEKGE